jgi:FkbM family methyltransferase
MKVKRFLYRFFIILYRITPFKIYVCRVLKRSSFFTRHHIHIDLKFKGKFPVNIPKTNQKFVLNAWNSTIENEIFWNGFGNTWEPETIHLWVKLCKKSNVIFDVGANTGIYSLIAGKLNTEAKIIAFEPSSLIIPKFKINMKDNNLNVQLIEKGVSNEDGEKVFYDVKGSHQSSASLSDQKLKYFEGFQGEINEYRIQTLRLDSFIEETGLIPDLIKIDVELHEPEVIEGLGEFLINNGPTLIIEVLTETVAEKLNYLFRDTSYFFYELNKMNEPRLVNSIKPKSCYNYLITKESF